ncbi:MAG: diacylglycerol kinase family lipid kinase [Dictyoglomaceae bacterium]|nr:diacylglycerol kinase family lipid kinase [Dictyoglomaceae bacterium]
MKYHVFVNPTANRGKGRKFFSYIKRLFEKENFNFNIEFTEGKEKTIKQVEDALERGAEVIVAAGGDGTVNEIVNGLKGKGILGIIPIGRGNDIAISLKIPRNIEKAIKILKKGKCFDMDLGMIDGRYFVGITGMGFDAEVNISANKIPLKGSLGYILSVFTTLGRYKEKECEISFDGNKWKGKITLIAIGNTKNYAGGMKILPNSSLNDGYFDICLVEKISPLELILYFPLIFFGKHTINPRVKMFRAKEVIIKGQDDLMATMDGELIPAKSLVLKNLYQAQKVIVGG